MVTSSKDDHSLEGFHNGFMVCGIHGLWIELAGRLRIGMSIIS